MNYGFGKKVELSFDEAVLKVRTELSKEGVGVLTEIDVKATLKKKLDVDYGEYIILGACNPPFAYEALKAEKEIGLFLPCNVIVYVDKGEIYVSAINPIEAMSIVENEKLEEVAKEVGEKLKRVIDLI